MRDELEIASGIIRRFTDSLEPALSEYFSKDAFGKLSDTSGQPVHNNNRSQLSFEAPARQSLQVDTPIKDDNSSAINELQDALQRYQTQNIKPKLDLDIRTCTWDDVLNHMEKAGIEYHQKARGVLGTLRRLCRKAGRAQEIVATLLDVIPDSGGANVLKAGISLIFLLAKQSRDNRDKIFNAFQVIPERILFVEKKRAMYPQDGVLADISKRFAFEVLSTITTLMAILLPESHKKKLSWSRWCARFKQTNVDETIAKLQAVSDDVNNRVDDIKSETLMEIYRISQKTDEKVSFLVGEVHSMREDVSSVVQNMSSLNATCSGQFEALKQYPEKFGLFFQQLFMRISNFYREQYLQDELRKECQLNSMLIMESRLALQNKRFQASYDDFVDAVGMSENISVLANDLDYVVGYHHNIDVSQMRSFSSVYTSDKLMRLLCSCQSELVLLESRIPCVSQRITTQSVSVAAFAVGLSRALPNSLNLVFFGGRHNSNHDSVSGPRGMLRCFLYEIASHLHSRECLDLSFINHEDRLSLLSGSRDGDVIFLCEAFYHLVTQLPQQNGPISVNFFIDNAPALMRETDWQQDFVTFFENFYAKQTEYDQKGVRLKFILTSPHANTECVKDVLQLRDSEVVKIFPNSYLPAQNIEQMISHVNNGYDAE